MGAIAGPAAMLLDPLNITGAQDSIANANQRGSQIGYSVGTPPQPGSAAWEQMHGSAKTEEPGKLKGFVESMGGWDGGKFRQGNPQIAPPPPPQWIYEQGKGATWGTPERTGSTNDFTFKGNAAGTPGYNAHKGNRF